MRIYLNQRSSKDQKPNAKFFEMAIIFAREHNKIREEELNKDVQEGERLPLPDDQQIKIVLPYSFLLTKSRLLLPEFLETVRDGQEERKFIKLVNDNRDLFEFVFTEEDRKLYKELYRQSKSLLATSRTSLEAEAAAKARASHTGVISESEINSLRQDARAINNDLKWAGHKLETWFDDNGISDGARFPLLRANSDLGASVSGPGLFRAMLVNKATRGLFKFPPGFVEQPHELPPVSEANRAIYADLFKQASALLVRINEDILTREVNATEDKRESMRKRDKPQPKISSGEMELLRDEVSRLRRYADGLPSQWLVDNKICSQAENDELDLTMFQAIMGNSRIRNIMGVNAAIDACADQSLFDLAMEARRQGEPLIYAVDNRLHYDKALAGPETHASLSPDFAVAAEMALAPSQDLPEDDQEEARRKSAISEILAHKRAVVKKKVQAEPPPEYGMSDYEVMESGQLFRSFLKRLDRMKNGEDKRDQSIELAKDAILHAAERHGHGSSLPNKPLGSIDDDLKPVPVLGGARPGPKDPYALAHALQDIEAILERDGKRLPSSVRGALNAAKKAGENLTDGADRGGASRAADES